MLLPIFNELGHTAQRRNSVFSLFTLSLFADIHKLMSSVDVEILSSNESILSEGEEQCSIYMIKKLLVIDNISELIYAHWEE